MATIPGISDPGLENSTGQLGRAMQGASAPLLQEVLRQKRDDDIAAVKDATASAENDLLDALHGANGYLSLRGKDAVDKTEPAMQGLRDRLRATAEAMPEGQKRIWSQIAPQIEQRYKSQILSHYSQERREYEIKAGTAHMATQLRVATEIGNPLDQNSVSAMQTYRREAQTVAMKRFGGSMAEDGTITLDEAGQGFVDAAVANLHQEMVSALVAQNKPEMAQAYFKANRAKMDPEARNQFEKLLAQDVAASEAIAAVDGLQAKYGANPAKIEAALLEKYRNKPEALKEARQEWTYRWSRLEQQFRDTDAKSRGEGYLMIMQGANKKALLSSPSYIALGKSAAAGSPFAADFQGDLIHLWEQRQRELRQPASQDDKWESKAALQTLIDLRSGNPKAFLDLDLTAWARKNGMTISDLNQALTMRNGLEKQDMSQKSLYQTYDRAMKAYAGSLASIGVDVTLTDKDLNSPKGQRLTQFKQSFLAAIQSHMDANGGKTPQAQDLDRIFHSTVTPVYMDSGSWYRRDKKMLAFEVAPGDAGKTYIKPNDVDVARLRAERPRDYTAIYNALKVKLGRSPYKDEMQEEYANKVNNLLRGAK